MFIPEDISKRAEKYSAEYSPHDFYTTFIVSILWSISTTHKMPYLEDFIICSS